MKLHVLSDLHIEFAEFSPPPTDAEVVVLAGDVGVGLGGIEWASRHFADKPVIYVPGNHEYYDDDLSLVDTLKARAPANIHVLDDATVEIGGIRFIGSTLWTDFSLYGEGEKFHAMRRAGRELVDFSCIRDGDHEFTPEGSIRLHELSKAYIQDLLAAPYNGPTVVVTHHLPSTMSIAPRFAADPLNPAFASRLEPLIESGQPEFWVHGHTHEAVDYDLFNTRIICNPRGYPNEVTTGGFVRDLVVQI